MGGGSFRSRGNKKILKRDIDHARRKIPEREPRRGRKKIEDPRGRRRPLGLQGARQPEEEAPYRGGITTRSAQLRLRGDSEAQEGEEGRRSPHIRDAGRGR